MPEPAHDRVGLLASFGLADHGGRFEDLMMGTRDILARTTIKRAHSLPSIKTEAEAPTELSLEEIASAPGPATGDIQKKPAPASDRPGPHRYPVAKLLKKVQKGLGRAMRVITGEFKKMRAVKRTAKRRRERRGAVLARPSFRTADGNGTNVPEDPRRAVEPFVCPTVEDWVPPDVVEKPYKVTCQKSYSQFSDTKELQWFGTVESWY
jgi:hypothetical protein